ncbi:MAG TPA: hypothetical protein VMF88_15270 [Bacteroidota bacterium]|nr:hypothetical protein [Bacteroidota bacterium]
MATITDDYMREMLMKSRNYSIVILKATAKRSEQGAEKIVFEHARRNFSLRADGILPIVCPITDESEVRGIGIFNASPAEVKQIMDGDPGVMAGIFTYEIHPGKSFPGDALPR